MNGLLDILTGTTSTASNGVGGGAPLTADTIRRAVEEVRKLGPIPPAPRYDLFGHDLDGDKASTMFEMQSVLAVNHPRSLLIAPRRMLRDVYRQLLEMGVDVRLEPRGFPNPDTAHIEGDKS